MKYFKANSLITKPFVYFQSVANSQAELIQYGLNNDPLVLAENLVPAFQFGVCPLKIVNGALVPRTTAEMNAFEAEWLAEQKLRAQAQAAEGIENETFMFQMILYPMNRSAHLRYLAMAHRRPAVTNLQAVNRVIPLAQADIDGFMEAFYDKMLNLTEPLI